MTVCSKNWLQARGDQTKLNSLLAEWPQLSPVVGEILINRGLKNKKEVEKFFSFSLENLHDPFLLTDMEKAVVRVLKALEKKEKILIYGDYDVDGITSTSVLLTCLRKLGGFVEYYLPHRLEEGYGINQEAIKEAQKRNVKLIITVDCGISAWEEVELSNDLGLDMIVTDHHQIGEKLPAALAVINPKRQDSSYPFSELAGVGVAYKLAEAVLLKLDFAERNELLQSLRELVAIGTVADVVPLLGENRILVKNGLDSLQHTKRLGLLALKERAGLKEKEFTTHTIGFTISPRLNALGRLCSNDLPPQLAEKLENSSCFTMTEGFNVVCLGVEILLSENEQEATEIAVFLDEENKRRQQLESKILQKALEILEKDWNPEKDRVIVLGGEDWHLGVIGIVASRLMNRYYRPVILLNFQDGLAKGSARSIKGFHLFTALQECSDLLEKYGGHELAAGLTLQQENLELFREKINSLAWTRLDEKDLIPSLMIEVDDVNLDGLSFNVLKQLEAFAPYGCGNTAPLLACRQAHLLEYKTVGKDGKHLKLKVATGKETLDAIAFGLGSCCCQLDINKNYDLAFTLEKNEWQGRVNLQLNVEDIKENEKKVVLVQKEELEADFYLSELVGLQVEVKQSGEQLFLHFDQRNKVVQVLDANDTICGFLNNRLEKKIRPYLRAGRQPFVWIVQSEAEKMKIAISFSQDSLLNEAYSDKKIIIFPTALHAYRSYQQFDDKNQAAIVHGALSLLQRSEMIVKWQNGYINTLFSTEKFHENYGKYFLAKISAHNVQIEKKEDYLNNMLIKLENWQDFIPSRDFLLALYKILRAKISFTAKQVFISLEFEEIICFLAEQGWQDCTCQQVKIGLDILEEMNLLNRELEGEKNYLCALPIPEEKFNLSSLLRYQEQLAIENYLK